MQRMKGGRMRELIVQYVQEYFFFFKDFYTIPATELNADKWAKLKAGHSSVENYKYNKVVSILNVLFTEYEQLLIRRILEEADSNQKKGLLDLFVENKTNKLIEWLNGGGALKISSNLENVETKPFIEIANHIELENFSETFSMRFRPRGKWNNLPELSKVNLKDWLLENKDNLI